MGESAVPLRPLTASPRESLSIELKSWLDPTHPPHRAVLVKTLMALRNRNGGTLYIGLRDDGVPCRDPAPFKLEVAYSADALQDVIARHSSGRFEVTTTFLTFEGSLIAQLDVPPGVTTPVAVKSEIPAEGKPVPHLRFGEVPFRSLQANGRASTVSCSPNDWAELVTICFNNREADIGGPYAVTLRARGPPSET